MMRTLAAILLGLALLATSTPALALSEQAEIEKARVAFVTRNYRDVEMRLRHLLEGNNLLREPANIAQARMFLGAALVEQHREEEAIPLFEQVLLDDPGFDPDPLTFPSKTLEAFIDTRAQMRDRLAARAEAEARKRAEQRRREELERRNQAARLAKLEEMAAEQHVTVKHSRFVASMPFGIGQFQNKQVGLGVLFLATEAALSVGSAITLPIYARAQSRKNEELRSGDLERKADGYRDRAMDAWVANRVLLIGLGVTMIAGIVQAHVNFVPETIERKTRPIPPPVTVRPQGAPVVVEGGGIQGASLGLTGTF